MDWSRRGLETAGFEGFVPFADLDGDLAPAAPGVYVVVWPGPGLPRFLPASTAGWFKKRDPSVPIAVLQRAWVAQSPCCTSERPAAARPAGAGSESGWMSFAGTVKVNLSATGVGASSGSYKNPINFSCAGR